MALKQYLIILIIILYLH